MTFLDHMRDVGCYPSNPDAIISDDKIRRFHVEGDKPGRLNGSYQWREDADGFAFGWVMTFKEGVVHKWHSKSKRGMTAEEKAERRKRADQARRDADKAREYGQASAAVRAAKMWDRASKDGSSAYLQRKGIKAHGARFWRGMVIVPVRRGPDIASLQFISEDGSKRFLKGGAIEGAYASIATGKDDLSRIVICEGFATGGTIRQALGCPVIVAFNSGNLVPVAKAIRARYPDAEIIIAADNDQWTKRPNGDDWNPGVEAGQAAAVAIGGARVLYPMVAHDDPERATDWNDVGEGAVIEAFTRPVPTIEDGPDSIHGEDYNDADYSRDMEFETPPDDPLDSINPQGHNEGTYYFYPSESGQITGIRATEMGRIQNLYRLAPRRFWDMHYGIGGDVSDSKICAMASAHLMDACHRRGIYLPETTRGVGVWMDDGKVAVNTGDAVICDGVGHDPSRFRGAAVYESGPRVIRLAQDPLRNNEADQLRQICRSLTWQRSMYADLLAGWLVIAPVGGALNWRSHIWLTGQSGAGKSTVMGEIVMAVLRNIGIFREGGTTEAAVRRAIGRSSRPYILDEAESEGARARVNMQAILTLCRIASSGGIIENANDKFRAQSCFMFSSINPSVDQLADESRITMLNLDVDRSHDRKDRFNSLLERIRETLTPEYAARLFRRTVDNIDALIANAATYSTAAALTLGNARAGDQLGPMLAGAFLLTSTRKVSLDEAKSWIAAQDWNWHEGGDDGQSDSHRCLSHIMSARVAYDVSGSRREATVGALVKLAARGSIEAGDQALVALMEYGINVKDGRLLIANQSPPIKRIMHDTPWSVWKSSLSRYPGADNAGGRTHYFSPGIKCRAVSIPVDDLMQPSAYDGATDWSNVMPEDML